MHFLPSRLDSRQFFFLLLAGFLFSIRPVFAFPDRIAQTHTCIVVCLPVCLLGSGQSAAITFEQIEILQGLDSSVSRNHVSDEVSSSSAFGG